MSSYFIYLISDTQLTQLLVILAVAVFALIIVGMVLNNHENTNVKKKFELAENTTRIICIDAKNNKVRYFNKSNIEHQVVCTLEEFLNNFPTEEKVRFEKWIDELLSTKKNVSDYLEVDVIFEREKKSYYSFIQLQKIDKKKKIIHLESYVMKYLDVKNKTDKKKISVTEKNLHKYLGKEKYKYQMVNPADEVGIVRGLAWTSVGGDTLQIEVNVMPGKGEIALTGQLGDVMKESAGAGISYIRSVSEKYEIAADFFEKHDIHVHIPEGAVPKDGPSAGITMATAILSAITERKVHADLAMTGEITLRGRVLPIGGLKEKLLAAKNAGIKTVLVPKENQVDVEELSSEITKGLEIIPVESMDEVLKEALV